MLRTASAVAVFSAAVIAQQSGCTFDPSVHYFHGALTPTYSKTWSIRYANSYKVLNVTTGGKSYLTTVSVCGAPIPTLTLGTNDVLVGQLVQPITKLGITSTNYAPYLDVRCSPRRHSRARVRTCPCASALLPCCPPPPQPSPPSNTRPPLTHTHTAKRSMAPWAPCP